MAEIVLESEVGKRLRNALRGECASHVDGFGVFEAEVTKVEEEIAPPGTPFRGRAMTVYTLNMTKLVQLNETSKLSASEFTVTSPQTYDCGPRGPVEDVIAGSKILVGVYRFNSGVNDSLFAPIKLPDAMDGQSHEHNPHDTAVLGAPGHLVGGQTKPFPSHWGEPPKMQTRDMVVWPAGYGEGSGTIARWIQENLAEDTAVPGSAGNLIPGQAKPFPSHWGEPPMMQTRDFRPWPQDFGQGSGTVAQWIQEHIDEDAAMSGSPKNMIPGQTTPFPSSWGEPPKMQTKDMCEWPAGYGSGSGTIAKWIERNLKKESAPRGSADNMIPGQVKPFPAEWGEPPRMQTRDMRMWRGGYGQGSGTIATWIQEHLVRDSMVPGQAKPFPNHWGEPPKIQTRDFRTWPEGYGQGSGTMATWIQTNLDKDAAPPGSAGNLIAGQTKPFPSHWGEPPKMQTKDLRPWPQGYGQGSGTVAAWIQENINKEAAPLGSATNMIPGQTKPFPSHWGEPPKMQTRDFRPWPNEYGEGSGTVAAWIQSKLDKDSAPRGSAGNLIPGQTKPFPTHWGEPPKMQTRDLRPWPEDYGQGSGSIASWIQQKLDEDKVETLPTKLSYTFGGAARVNHMPPTYVALVFDAPSAVAGSSPNRKLASDHLNYPLNFYMSFKAELHGDHATVDHFKRHLNYFYSIVTDPYSPPKDISGPGSCNPPGTTASLRLKSGNSCHRAPEALDFITFDSWDGEVLKGTVKEPPDTSGDAKTALEIHFTLRVDFH